MSRLNPSPSVCSATTDKKIESFALDPLEERRIVRKLDLHLITITTFFYFLSFLDRANIGNARVAGLQEDLGLSDQQYQICVTVLYVPYIVAELPTNLLLRRLGANIVMPTILTLWGVVCALQGVTKSYAGLATVRVFLGLLEGPMFPAIVLYLSGFYTRRELSLRISMFFSAASLSGAFSGLLAAAIQNMDGLGGRPGWAWIFILEGIFSSLIGISGFFLVPATPHAVKFLKEEERRILIKRLQLDRPTFMTIDDFSFRQIIRSVMSPHVILMLICCFVGGTVLFGLALFLPTIVNQLGFSPTHTQLISVGPFAVAFLVTLVASYYSDLYENRAIPICLCAGLAAIGWVLFLCSKSKAMSYGSLFLSVSGIYAQAPIVSAWVSNNSEPHYRRATSVALAFMCTNAGGILSTWSFPDSESPRFLRATIMDLTFSASIVFLALLNLLYLSWKTRQKRVKRERILEQYSPMDGYLNDSSELAWSELGDKHPDFQYSL